MPRTIAAIVLLLVLGISLSADGELRCTQCRKLIGGKYMEVNGKAFCSNKCLLETRAPCTACGRKVMKGGFFFNKKFVCSEKCLNKLRPKCSQCGTPVKGGEGGLKAEGKYFCGKACFTKTLTPCHLCGARNTNAFKINGRIYCDICSNKTKCLLCGSPCGDSVVPDGRPICLECKRVGIIRFSKGKQLLLEVQKVMTERLGAPTDSKILFHLVDVEKFREANGKEITTENGLYNRETIITSTTVTVLGVDVAEDINSHADTRKDIYILSWLDEVAFRMIAAHELMHDWTSTRFPDIEDGIIIEGLSEYMGWLVCRHYRYQLQMDKIRDNDDPVYGDGFRLVKAQDKGGGLKDIIEWLASGKWKRDLAKLKAKQALKNPKSQAPKPK
ncbi:hypothetical protein ACFL4W_02995 [Planctomycetota bacterium]